MTERTQMAISEIFGPTIQGEGPMMGVNAAFIRLAGCNLDCRWCDTPYSWDFKTYDKSEEVRMMDPYDVVQHESIKDARFVVITGGEPLLQRDGLELLIDELAVHQEAGLVEIETNGTIAPFYLGELVKYNVSPKLRNSGVGEARRLTDALGSWAELARQSLYGEVRFKFVIDDPLDIGEVANLMKEYDIPPAATWLMPQGRMARELDARLYWIAEAAATLGCNVSDRLHIRIWGNERGK